MFAVKTYVRNQPEAHNGWPRRPSRPRYHNNTGLHARGCYCGIYSKSWINLQSETRSRCEGTWRTRLWNTLEIKSKMSWSQTEPWWCLQLIKSIKSDDIQNTVSQEDIWVLRTQNKSLNVETCLFPPHLVCWKKSSSTVMSCSAGWMLWVHHSLPLEVKCLTSCLTTKQLSCALKW